MWILRLHRYLHVNVYSVTDVRTHSRIYSFIEDDTSFIPPSLQYSMIFRYISNIYPLHGHFCNYGAFPQTWEDPFKQDPWTGQIILLFHNFFTPLFAKQFSFLRTVGW